MHKIGDEYVVFYIGVGQPVADADLPQSIGAAYSTSPDGPWTRMDQPLLKPEEGWECGGNPEPNCGVSNPAVVPMADGSVLMFYRGNNDRGVGVASAPTWRGPYTRRNNASSIFQGSIVVGLEDMYEHTENTIFVIPFDYYIFLLFAHDMFLVLLFSSSYYCGGGEVRGSRWY